jgi:RNA polymerase sigma-70 factor, ECF subfamily
MSHRSRVPRPEATFVALYQEVYPDLLRFVQRRAHPDHADDVVAEAFLVAWRRLDKLPEQQADARAWVFGIARHVMLNNHRGAQRRRALAVRLVDAVNSHPSPTDRDTDLVVSRLDLARAWTLLSDVHQEALGMTVLDDLSAPQAATVLGISPVAFRLRLSRARRTLRLHLDHLPHATGKATGSTVTVPATKHGRTMT